MTGERERARRSEEPGGAEPRWGALLDARAVAIFGASDRTPIHRVLLENVALGGAAAVVGVNPNRRTAGEVPCVPSAGELPFVPDTAVIVVPDGLAEASVGEALAAGSQAVVLPGLGRTATTDQVRDRIATAVRAAGALLLGPDCMGAAAPGGFSPWIGSLPAALRPGSIGLVSQSGAVAEAVIALGGRLGLSRVLSTGNELTIDVADACDALMADETTRAIGLFVETVRRPAALQAVVASAAQRDVPIVCLKSGRSQAARTAALAHSGAVAGDPEAFDAYARSIGLLQVPDFATFVETLAVLDGRRRPRGPRIAAVTNSGGEAQLLADEALAVGAPFDPVSDAVSEALTSHGVPAVNPVDGWNAADAEGTFRAVFELLAASGDYDVLVAQVDQAPGLAELETENGLALAGAAIDAAVAHDLTPVIVSGIPSEPAPRIAELAAAHGAPVLRTTTPALRALTSVGRWARRQALGVPAATPRIDSPADGDSNGVRPAAARQPREPGARRDAPDAVR